MKLNEKQVALLMGVCLGVILGAIIANLVALTTVA